MKTIKLKKITLKNFKGVKSKTISFSDKTEIRGDNGTFKSTTVDAFLWCMFGKDSHGSSDFSIKTIGLTKKEHSVVCLLDTGEVEYSVKRLLREKWVKKRGEEKEVFTGHETIFEIDSIVYKKNEFKKFIDDIIDEDLFRLVSSNTYFQSLNWEKRRDILFSMVDGEVDINEVAKGNEKFEKLLKYLNGKSFEDYQKQIKSKILALNKDYNGIPERINELEATINDDIDYEALRKEKAEIVVPDNSAINKLREEIEAEITKKRSEHELEQNKLRAASKAVDLKIEQIKESIKKKEELINENKLQVKNLRDSFYAKKKEVFKEATCPTCNQSIKDFTEEDFNNQRAEAIKEINTKGKNLNLLNESLSKELGVLVEKLLSLKPIPYEHVAYDESELRKTMPSHAVVDSAQSERLEKINMDLGTEASVVANKSRILELRDSEKKLSKDIAAFERTSMVCEDFLKAKVAFLSERINSMFSMVTFNLFEKQVNGDSRAICDTMINGVPFSDANTAAQINAGIDIINTLSKHYSVSCPVFLDNMESCLHPLEVSSQSISLIADVNYEKLEVKQIK